MLKRLAPLIFFLFILVSCAKNEAEQLIVGQWYNESMMVELDAKSGKIDSVFNVPVGEWESILEIKPIETTYDSDGGYASEYFGLTGEKMQTSEGQWSLAGDSLYLTEGGKTTGYHFRWLEGKAIFRGYLDWDNDGLADDLYTGIQIKR